MDDVGARRRATLAAYRAGAESWVAGGRHERRLDAGRWVGEAPAPGPLVDLGCGPGWNLPTLGPTAVGLDAAVPMLAVARHEGHDAPLVCADVAALPFRSGSLGGALASKVYVHLPRSATPRALADLHRSLTVGARVELVSFEGDQEFGPFDGDRLGGRSFANWPPDLLDAVLVGAGFSVAGLDRPRPGWLAHRLVRERTLPDFVGPGLRLLVVGLNPSLHAADAGVGYVTPSNRFWRAAIAAGLVSIDRDPWHALDHHGLGMTDVVKRATPRAAELSATEYRAGLERLERLVAWLAPGAVCFVGLAGWRAAVDRQATAGVQRRALGGRPVYVSPSTSGLNATTSLDDLIGHFRAATALADAALADAALADTAARSC